MSDADKLFQKLQTIKLSELLQVCAGLLESNSDKKRIDVVFQILEIRLQKRRIAERLGLKDE